MQKETTTIEALNDLFNAGKCFTKGKQYEVNGHIKIAAGLMEAQTINDKGETHIIGSWWRDFTIVEIQKTIDELRDEYEGYLNDYYEMALTPDAAFEELQHLTVPARGEHISEEELKSDIAAWKAGSTLRRLDPIGFNVGCDDHNNIG